MQRSQLHKLTVFHLSDTMTAWRALEEVCE